ncbi:AAA family ATPase [Kovacikia minuta CCNUW1]|uniref:trifunctional serine/threonine-protein kinase/ATP-binding protein/sensor histidine kinase n=1 Tax=Kovacikia minuta TaxID=2931930 RepID=UPI001CCBA671|nr:ATP-binding sensor histidine kinase [Kovacikia minuta]UBF25955.1 AAA family ATPase [Kovacikia minuta CCNUW1]
MVATAERLAGYQILDQIYAGTRTLIYRARRSSDQQPVIIKLLQNEHPSFTELAQFRNQYTIAKNLDLPEVIQTYSLEPYKNSYALVMEDFDGISLKQVMGQWGDRGMGASIPGLKEFLRIALQITAGLNGLYRNNVIHKDIKPANILINPSTQQVKIIDFSIASLLPREAQAPTNPNVLEGTLAYLSPEQTGRMNRGVDYRTDFYSLGVTFYELLTGQLPFQSRDAMELVHCHLAKQPVPPHLHSLLPTPPLGTQNSKLKTQNSFPTPIPEVLSNIVLKLMAKNAEDRYQSASGLRHDLENCLHQLETTGEIVPFELGSRDISDRFIISEKLYGRQADVETLLAAYDRVAGGQGAGGEKAEGVPQSSVLSPQSSASTQNSKLKTQNSFTSHPPSPIPLSPHPTPHTPHPTPPSSSELILIAGFSGIGKTAIVNEIHKPIAQGTRSHGGGQGAYFIKGKFDQFQRNIPFSAIVQAFRDLIEQLLKESNQQIERWKADILEAVGEQGQAIIDVIPEVELLIGKQPPLAELEPISAQNRLNWVFQKFIRVFPSAAHPLVIFVDDLQWADSASLNLIQSLMGETEIRHLLVIGAYRDNEVSPVHPLMQTLNEIKKARTIVNTITLTPLNLSDLNQLIADSLHCSAKTALPLAQLVFTKTKGNPFFSNQFLKALYENNLITFNFDTASWQWDINPIQTLSLTEDVVEFMAAQLQKLPQPTQDVLQLAACIGNQFDLETLAIVYGSPQAETAAALWDALQAGLVLSGKKGYKFLHDRVQQAAYLLIPADQKAATHLKIGQLLLASIPAAEREEKIFEIVNQLNYGVALIKEPCTRNELAQLNLLAARKATATTVYTAAAEYATTGINLLKADSWQRQYELTLALYEAAVEATCLTGDFETMEQFSATAMYQTKTVLDGIKIYAIKIQAYTSQNKLLEAIAIARRALEQLGASLPDNPTEVDIQQAFQETATRIAGKTIDDLMNLPSRVSVKQLAIIRIASSVVPAAYIAAPNLLPLIILLQVNLSVLYGNTPWSAFGYANYSLLLKSALQDIEAADQFGKLAFNLAAKFNSNEVKARTYYVLAAFIIHGKAHVQETLPLLREGYQTALETGNLEFVGYCAKEMSIHAYLIGQELSALETEMRSYSHALENLKQTTSLTYSQIYWQAVLNLLGKAEDCCTLSGEALQEETILPSLTEANDISGLHYFYLNKLILCYLFEDFTQAIDVAAKAAQYLAGGTGFITVPIFHFYDSLAALATYPTGRPELEPELEHRYSISRNRVSGEDIQRNLSISQKKPGFCTGVLDPVLQRIAENQIKLQQWAHHAPMNYLHKYYLVEAERHRILGDRVTAMEFYDRAIALAKEHEYLNEEALAYELAARFYYSWDKTTIAQVYLMNAYHTYERWGAIAKLDDLERHYPELLTTLLQPKINSSIPDALPSFTTASLTHSTESISISSSSVSEVLDFSTVLKASQALSGEIQLEKLLTTLMQVVLENAGAQTGALLLSQGDELVIQAQAIRGKEDMDGLQITSLQSLPVQSCSEIPLTLINYVSRTLKTLVIDDATVETTFASDPYIITHQPKSILCTSIRNQGKLIGILYLENNLTRGSFTRDRLQVLKLLTTQAAISLENALLYNHLAEVNQQLEDYNATLEQKVAERTQELNQKTQHLEQTFKELQHTQTQLIQTEKMSSLGQLVAGVAHEINNPVNFIHGNLLHTNEYVQALFDVLAAYQQEYPEPNPRIEAAIQDADLAFLLEDLPKLLISMKVGSDRIRNIILGLRNFSRLDEAEMKPVDIHEGINSTLMILQHRLKAKPDCPAIEVIRAYGKLPKVECYAGQLNQVFMNILSNAIDALEEVSGVRGQGSGEQEPEAIHNLQFTIHNLTTPHTPHPTPRIQISTEVTENQWAVIRIRDNGPGMPEEVQQKIFDPFFTTKSVGKGTGLGLSISYQIIVDKHRGKLTCNSTPGEGTEFVVEVPIE